MTAIETTNELTLVDYFVIAGYDSAVGLQPEACTSAEERLRPPLERSYVARILAHYPRMRLDRVFASEILSLCLPKGLRFCTQKDVNIEPSVHNFVNIRENGTKVDGTALIFYEEVRDQSLCQAMSDLHTAHVRDLTNLGVVDGVERTPVPPGMVSGGSHTLPRGSRKDRNKRVSYYEGGQNILYVTKCICLISRLPIVQASERILRAIHSVIAGRQTLPLAIDCYIYWLLHEVPLPAAGSTLKVSLGDADVVLQRPVANEELPFFDYSLRTLFQLISIEKFLKLFTCFLLEHQILLCSTALNRLMLVAESLCAFAFPFRWQMAYVPILPYSRLEFMEAPISYVLGLCYETVLPEQIFQSNVCVLDIDSGHLDLPEDLPPLPDRIELVAELQETLNRHSERTTADHDFYPVRMRQNTSQKRKDDWQTKRMSRSFDDENSSINFVDADDNNPLTSSMGIRPAGSNPSRPTMMPLPFDPRDNEILARYGILTLKDSFRVAAIARRAGVSIEMDTIEQELNANDAYVNSPTCQTYFKDLKLNNSLREAMLNRFCCMFYSYEHFVIGAGQCADRESFLANRDSVVNFDKASFLSDQPDSHLPFLAAFLETQMFASFIDAKILSQWQEPDENLLLFDSRVHQLRVKLGSAMIRTPIYEQAPAFVPSEELINKREEAMDYVVPLPHQIAGAAQCPFYDGTMPLLNPDLFEIDAWRSPLPSPWKQRHRHLRPKQLQLIDSEYDVLSPEEQSRTNGNNRQSTYGNAGLDPAQLAQSNLMFVEQLLKETKGKTKRMLVEKMGKREAVQLGHGDNGITGLEENTVVAGFCDLLERIWAHGLVKKQGKSALWTYLINHQEMEKTGVTSTKTTTNGSLLKPAQEQHQYRQSRNGAWMANQEKENDNDRRRHSSQQRTAMAGSMLFPSIAQPPKNNNNNSDEERGRVTALVRSLQREVAASSNSADSAWSQSILRAANFICDRISQQQQGSMKSNDPMEKDNGRPLNPAAPNSQPLHRSQSFNRSDRTSSTMTKANSLSDLAPHWPLTNSTSNEETTGNESSPRKRSISRQRSPDHRSGYMAPLPTDIAYDLRNVLRMSEIKTDIGYARAFLRLSLERKLLHKHLKIVLTNQLLLRKMYKGYAFVQQEDEIEQFLYHILSLNAADFRCFTNTFTKTKMLYQVLLVTGNSRHNCPPGVWVMIAGSLGHTINIPLPPGSLQFTFDHKNLGILSTLRIGHQAQTANSTGSSPKWFLDHVLVRCNLTGQLYRFPCGKWFGRGVDDGSLERLLVAEVQRNMAVAQDEADDFASRPVVYETSTGPRRSKAHSRSRTPPRARSPSATRLNDATGVTNIKSRTRMVELQQGLGEAVNAIVKHFYQINSTNTVNLRGNSSLLTPLLCGERGLVQSLEQVFLFGRQDPLWSAATRFFKQIYPWDYVEKVVTWFMELLRCGEAKKLTREQRVLIGHACKLVARISGTNSALGKDGKFQVFILITVRDHVLSGLIPLMAWTPITSQMYEEASFFRTAHYLNYLTKLLNSLNEFQFDLEKSLTYNVE